MRVLDSLEVAVVEGKQVFRCLECGYILGPVIEGYKDYALKHDTPVSKAQPDFLVPSVQVSSNEFFLREYYCPKCGRMFEVDVLAKGEKQIESIRLRGVSGE